MLKIKTSPKKEPAMVSWSSTEEIGKLFSEKIPSADIPTLPLKLGETILSSTVQEWFVTISLFDFFTWMLAVGNISPQNKNSHCIMLDKPVYHASDQGLNNIWTMSAACVLQLRWLKKTFICVQMQYMNKKCILQEVVSIHAQEYFVLYSFNDAHRGCSECFISDLQRLTKKIFVHLQEKMIACCCEEVKRFP